jgi:hypothetical protein
MNPRTPMLIAGVALLAIAPPVHAQLLSIGGEFQISQYTEFHQRELRLATNAFGETLVVWESASLSGISGQDEAARR